MGKATFVIHSSFKISLALQFFKNMIRPNRIKILSILAVLCASTFATADDLKLRASIQFDLVDRADSAIEGFTKMLDGQETRLRFSSWPSIASRKANATDCTVDVAWEFAPVSPIGESDEVTFVWGPESDAVGAISVSTCSLTTSIDSHFTRRPISNGS